MISIVGVCFPFFTYSRALARCRNAALHTPETKKPFLDPSRFSGCAPCNLMCLWKWEKINLGESGEAQRGANALQHAADRHKRGGVPSRPGFAKPNPARGGLAARPRPAAAPAPGRGGRRRMPGATGCAPPAGGRGACVPVPTVRDTCHPPGDGVGRPGGGGQGGSPTPQPQHGRCGV